MRENMLITFPRCCIRLFGALIFWGMRTILTQNNVSLDRSRIMKLLSDMEGNHLSAVGGTRQTSTKCIRPRRRAHTRHFYTIFYIFLTYICHYGFDAADADDYIFSISQCTKKKRKCFDILLISSNYIGCIMCVGEVRARRHRRYTTVANI